MAIQITDRAGWLGEDLKLTRNSGQICVFLRKKSLPKIDPAGSIGPCFIYVALRLLNVRMTFVPLIFWLPLELVNSPVSFESATLPSKLSSNF